MLGYLLRPFSRVERPDRWNACIIGLDKARIDDGLLAVNLALFRLWNSSQHQWRNVESDNNPGNDPRVPTFIVIDEAHNYAPTEHRNAVQKRVTDKLIQIAAEGRKYGLYLILATQRPRKLHPHLVLECENCCLLRIQSKVEQEFLEKEFGIPHEEAGRIGKYEKGHALFHGRWMEGKQVEAAVAPARTIVGGGGVPDSWMAAPSFDTAMVFETQGGGAVEDVAEPGLHGGSDGAVASMPRREDHLVTRIQEVVRQAVEESLVPVSLSALGLKIRDLFGNEIIEATQWFGYLNLSALVRALNDEHVVYSPVGTGFVLDPSRHHEPIDEDVVDRVARVAPDYASLAARLHYEARIPLLAPGEYGVVFQIIVEEIRQNGFAMSQTAKAVRDQAKLSGVQLTRPGVNFILARLYSAGYSFEKTETAHLEAAGILAQRFTAGVVAFCEGIGMKLTTGDQEMIAKWVNDDLTSNPSGSAEQTP